MYLTFDDGAMSKHQTLKVSATFTNINKYTTDSSGHTEIRITKYKLYKYSTLDTQLVPHKLN